MNFETLYESMKTIFEQADMSHVTEDIAIEFQVYGEYEGVFYLEIKNGVVSMEPYEYIDRDALLIARGNAWLEIIRKDIHPSLAFAVGKLKVVGNRAKVSFIRDVFDQYMKLK
ncbi:MAG: SCP2 sterol-binding domain-containing protein [Lachnospiraceae bacterium]